MSLSSIGPEMVWDLEGMVPAALPFRVGGKETSFAVVALALANKAG